MENRHSTSFARREARVESVASVSDEKIVAATIVRRAANGPGADAVAAVADAATEVVDRPEYWPQCTDERTGGPPGRGHGGSQQTAWRTGNDSRNWTSPSSGELCVRCLRDRPQRQCPAYGQICFNLFADVVVGDCQVRADGPHHPNPDATIG